MKNKLWISSLLTLTVGLGVANGEMIKIEGGITLDTDTKLLWQDNLEAKTVKKKWQGAIDYCENLTLGGIDDWKLPDKDTLKALYPKQDSLQNIVSDWYWSSTINENTSSGAWGVNSGLFGFDNWSGMDNSSYVRCVRAGQSFDTLTFSSFVESLKTSNITEKSIVLSSSRDNKSQFFWVIKDGKNYFGKMVELLKQFGMQKKSKVGFSKNPFEDIQKLTQEKLNEYLTIPTIPSPTLPAPLNLTKDEFESKAEFTQRVASEIAKREAQIVRLQDEFRSKVEARNLELENRKANIETKKKEYLFDNFASVMGDPKLSNPTFDAETETMFVDVSMSNAEWKKKVAIKMNDLSVAKSFKHEIEKVKAKVSFGYENDGFVLQNIEIATTKKDFKVIKKTRKVNGFFGESDEEYTVNETIDTIDKVFVATLDKSDFKPQIVAVTIENKKVAFNELQNPNLVDKYQVQALGYGESNQAKGLKYNDDLTPMISKMATVAPNQKNWLFAVAIENYDEADAVIYAKNSAKSLITAMQKRLGISERNTYALIDEKATGGAIKGQLERLLENVKEGDNVYFYYSGHGIPSSENGEAFILPKDVIADYVTKEKEFMARNIYKKLSDSKAGKVVAFVDSCYSGKTDGISNIKGVAAGVFKTKKVEFDKSKMVVLTAGTNGQFSNAYTEKGQRLFSYFVTKALINRPTLDINSLYQEVSVGVKDESFKLGDNKRQEPQIEGNVEMGL